MTTTRIANSTRTSPLRLWPGVAIAGVLVLARYVVPALLPESTVFDVPVPVIGVLAGLAGALLIVLWWVLFSRAPWPERVIAPVLMVVALFTARLLVHESIRGGMMGMMLFMFAPPVLGLALVCWAAATRHLRTGPRRATLVATMVLVSGVFTLLRTDGITGDGASQLAWRWTPTAEDRLLALEGRAPTEPAGGPARDAAAAPDTARSAPALPAQPSASAPDEKPAATVPAESTKERPREVNPTEPATGSVTATAGAADDRLRAETPASGDEEGAAFEWPGFRGFHRDSIVRGVDINTDWTTTPPVELWRRPIGPGWSSFAVHGGLIYTQEQRGDDEVVSCYRLTSGDPVWQHRDQVRFWESNGGAGPRGTPTVHNGRVYAMGATGVLNVLDARSGSRVWSRNASTDTGVPVPDWGIASSPLVIDDLVVVAVSGQLIAYDRRTGEPRWQGPKGGSGYSSPHLVTIDGVSQIVLLRGSRTIGVAPADGTLLWEHIWQPGVGIVQPAVADAGDLLITTGDAMGGLGVRRIAVARAPDGWKVEERWTSRGLKPYFNDFVVHEGHAFGFDGSILAAIDLTDGARRWKGGRYGNGQLILLPDQDVLLVLSEEGELALVGARPDRFQEIARFPALEGKTWNHPVLIGDVLLVRNGEQMAAFRLALAGR